MTPSERSCWSEWNATAQPFPLAQPFHVQFEQQVERTPDAIAAIDGAVELSYRRLNAAANRLARTLVASGVGPEQPVALLAERGIGFLTAMLAIWKAGGAYIPLDPRHPPRRLAQVLENSRARLVLAGAEQLGAGREALRHFAQVPLLASLDELLGRPQDSSNLAVHSGPDSLAYVIFTSGSTGMPKGAMIEQRGMLNHLHAKVLDLRLTQADRVAQNASQCFDVSVWQFLAALLVGGSVDIISDDIAHDPAALLRYVETRPVSVLEVVPSLLGMLLEQLDTQPAHAFPALRWLLATGEALPVDLGRRWLRHVPDVPLVNAYGPTECSDDVTHHVMAVAPADTATRVPIGRPIANTQLYVLDSRLQPAPIGVEGQIYVGGAGVGRGYLHDAERTAQAFVADPFTSVQHEGRQPRLYRTGDRGRWLPDGTLDYLGRLDEQVKIRGFRIEPGEVQAALARYPDVADAAVLAREDIAGDRRLVAYVVPRDAQTAPAATQLRAFLRSQVPEYMVPSAFVVLDALPLTPNGKLDRRALPAPDMSQPADGAPFVAPRTPTEQQLAAIWCSVLERERIGVQDNFFENGGHSLVAARIVHQVNAAFGVDLPLRSLFEQPTIAELALRVEQSLPGAGRETERAHSGSSLVRLKAGGSLAPFFCVHPIGGTVHSYVELARRVASERPFYAFEAPGVDGETSAPYTLTQLAERYASELRAVQAHGPYLIGGWSFGGVVAFELARLLERAGEPIGMLALIDSRPSPGESGIGDTPAALQFAIDVCRSLGTSAGLLRLLGQVTPHNELLRGPAEGSASLAAAELQEQAALLLSGGLAGLSEDRQLDVVLAQLRSAGVLPHDLDDERLRAWFGAYRRNMAAWRDYRPQAARFPAVLLRASQARQAQPTDSAAAWRGLLGAQLREHTLPGDHYSVLAAPHVAVLAERLEASLQRAEYLAPSILAS